MAADDNRSSVQIELMEEENEDCEETKTVFGTEANNRGTITVTGTGKKEKPEEGYLSRISLTYEDIHQICTLLILGLLSWALAYSVFGASFGAGGELLRLVLTPAVGFVSGQLLQRLTSLPPLLGMVLAGIALVNLGFIDMRDFPQFDSTMRKIYPVIILGKSALGADYLYFKANMKRLLSLGVLPWTAEVVALAVCTKFILSYSWRYGILLGAVFSSLSPAVVVPLLQQQRGRGLGVAQDMARLVPTAGGIDTALSVGVYGLLLSAFFSKEESSYVIFKASMTLFVGVALGVGWGFLSDLVPNKKDPFVAEERFLVVLLGGLFANCGTLAIGWGGTGGVAVLACNMTAAHLWRQSSGWKINAHPVATAYRVTWTISEAMLFTFTATHFRLSDVSASKLMQMLAVLLASLAVRLVTAYLVGWRCGLRVKERIFVCITWIPKAIVEAVLAPTALDAVMSSSSPTENDFWCAKTNIHMLVIAILVTTPVGYYLTMIMGPVLLKTNEARANSLEDGTEVRRLSNSHVWSTSNGVDDCVNADRTNNNTT